MVLVSVAVPYSSVPPAYVERVVPAQPAVAREHVGARNACTAELNARETNGAAKGEGIIRAVGRRGAGKGGRDAHIR